MQQFDTVSLLWTLCHGMMLSSRQRAPHDSGSPVHCEKAPHHLLVGGRARCFCYGIAAFLVSKPEEEGVRSSLPDNYILLSKAVAQDYILLQSSINKLAL